MDLMKYLARVRDSRPPKQSGITQLFPSGPAYATGAETIAAIIAESTKAANDAGGRPLPLAANWHMYSVPMSWQLAKIDEGYPILPFVGYGKDGSVAAFTATGYPNGNADAIPQLAAYGLPFSMQTANLSDPLYSEADYAISVSDVDTACTRWLYLVTGAVANGTTSVTLTLNYDCWQVVVGSQVTISGLTGGWAALNGGHTLISRTGSTITLNIDGSDFGTWASSGADTAVVRVRKLSPMGTDAPWTALGIENGTSPVITWLQAQYPNPPRVFIIDNNESGKIGHSLAKKDRRFIDNYPILDAEMTAGNLKNSMELWHNKLIERHAALFSGFRGALTEPGWANKLKFVGYNATLSPEFRTSQLWWYGGATMWSWEGCFVEGEFNKIAWQPYAWDGATPNIYVWNNFGWYPFETDSQHTKAMVFKFAQDIAETVNPDYWGEFSSWDGELFDGGDHASAFNATYIKTTHGIDYSVNYYKGWMQWCMWMLRSRCVREFRYHVLFNDQSGFLHLDDPETPWGARWQIHLEMVSHVHQHPTLRRFWREGTLVENTNTLAGTIYTHPYNYMSGYTADTVKALAWDAYPKNYHLPTNLDHVDEYQVDALGRIPIYDPDNTPYVNSVDYPVWALAYVIGTTPNREWLVYAHSTGVEGATLTDVEVTIPDYQTITLPTVPVEGAFYHVVE